MGYTHVLKLHKNEKLAQIELEIAKANAKKWNAIKWILRKVGFWSFVWVTITNMSGIKLWAIKMFFTGCWYSFWN